MARIAPLSLRYAGIARLERASTTFGRVTALGALFGGLALVGSLVFRATAGLQRGFAAWAQARREREEDRKLWELALTDPRIMADLIALDQHTGGEARRLS